ncbi:MAG: hypothetical protein AB2718_11405, partial [Candidatus Thiodiazotropha taylori]
IQPVGRWSVRGEEYGLPERVSSRSLPVGSTRGSYCRMDYPGKAEGLVAMPCLACFGACNEIVTISGANSKIH